jgi:hypothetical protein
MSRVRRDPTPSMYTQEQLQALYANQPRPDPEPDYPHKGLVNAPSKMPAMFSKPSSGGVGSGKPEMNYHMRLPVRLHPPKRKATKRRSGAHRGRLSYSLSERVVMAAYALREYLSRAR